jgi:hypothetical protein
MRNRFPKALLVTSAIICALNASALRAEDTKLVKLVQTNLVSDIAGLAMITDPELVNPWGVSHSLTSPFWVSNQGKSTTTLYAVTDETKVTKININPQPALSKSRQQRRDRKDRVAKSTTPTHPRSRSDMAGTANRQTSFSPI